MKTKKPTKTATKFSAKDVTATRGGVGAKTRVKAGYVVVGNNEHPKHKGGS